MIAHVRLNGALLNISRVPTTRWAPIITAWSSRSRVPVPEVLIRCPGPDTRMICGRRYVARWPARFVRDAMAAVVNMSSFDLCFWVWLGLRGGFSSEGSFGWILGVFGIVCVWVIGVWAMVFVGCEIKVVGLFQKLFFL